MNSEFTYFSKTRLLALIAGMVWCAPISAQRARFEDPFQVQATQVQYPTPVVNSPPTFQGQPPAMPQQAPVMIQQPPVMIQQPPAMIQPPGVTFGNPSYNPPNFDPFQSANQPFPTFSTTPQPTYYDPMATQPGFGPAPSSSPTYYNQPGQPRYQGTNSSWLPSSDLNPQLNSFEGDFLPRLIERPRARYTFLPGDSANSLSSNDIELATTLNYPDFLQSNQPLRISPGFIFHFWDGPDTTVYPLYDMPAQAYSGYLAFDHMTNPAHQCGLETNFTVGYYSDFVNNSSYAIRYTGRLVGWTKINCNTLGKFGVEYLDRVKVKLLPVFGVYLTPSPDFKFDLTFPRSKLSQRLPNIANSEAWGYVAGEYGGGSWAIERMDGSKDQSDINDMRVYTGIEWMGPKRVTGFFDVGYVFNREIVYRSDSSMSLDLKDAIMLRTGFAF